MKRELLTNILLIGILALFSACGPESGNSDPEGAGSPSPVLAPTPTPTPTPTPQSLTHF